MEVLKVTDISPDDFCDKIGTFCRDAGVEESHPELARSLGSFYSYLQRSAYEVVYPNAHDTEAPNEEIMDAPPAPKTRKKKSRTK
jgi:hypothetical protein